jgi:hypothetical protein
MQFRAVAVSPSSYVLAGQQFKADIYLTAYDSHTNPTITVGGSLFRLKMVLVLIPLLQAAKVNIP